MALNPTAMDGPIPGANFTSDTKNYAWHRPPEYTDLDEAIDYIGKKLTTEESSYSSLTLIEQGVTIADLAQIILTMGIMEGKWTLDFALLLAGPTAHILYIMAKSYDIDCDLGIDTKLKIPTKALFDAAKKPALSSIEPEQAVAVAREAVAEVQAGMADKGGFMGAPAPQEDTQAAQAEMLGDTPEEIV